MSNVKTDVAVYQIKTDQTDWEQFEGTLLMAKRAAGKLPIGGYHDNYYIGVKDNLGVSVTWRRKNRFGEVWHVV